MFLGLTIPQMILIIGICALIFIVFIFILFILKRKKTGSKIKVDEVFMENLIENYGGITNIVEVGVDNARLKIEVKDLEIVKLDEIKGLSEAGVFVTGNTIKTLYKVDSALIKTSLEKKL